MVAPAEHGSDARKFVERIIDADIRLDLQYALLKPAQSEYRRAELRSPDPLCNPYLAFALLIRAGLDGIRQNVALPEAADLNLYTAPAEITAKYQKLPETLEAAKAAAKRSDFVAQCLPDTLIRNYTR